MSKSAKLGRNPFEKPMASPSATARLQEEVAAENHASALSNAMPLLRALLGYIAAESALVGIRFIDRATELLSAKKRAV
jgi:hypothetical protein